MKLSSTLLLWFTRSSSIAVLLASCSTPRPVGSSATFHPYSHKTSAVDSNGIRHLGSDYPGNPPWLDDRVQTIAPDYPYSDRRNRHEGTTIVRLTLDLRSGSVVSAVVIKSSGFKTLDDCAVAALLQWRWKSGKWKRIDMPVKFELGNPVPPLPPGAVRLPPPH